jgi:hypothetical protein
MDYAHMLMPMIFPNDDSWINRYGMVSELGIDLLIPVKHVLMLLALEHGSGLHPVLFVVRIFGGTVHVIRLAGQNVPAPPIDGPIFMTIDYANHVIESYDLLQMTQTLVGQQSAL